LRILRIHHAGVSPDVLMNDLQTHPVPQLVLRRDRGAQIDWYAFDVDEELLRKLRHRGCTRFLVDRGVGGHHQSR
jgi:hypothetical protein